MSNNKYDDWRANYDKMTHVDQVKYAIGFDSPASEDMSDCRHFLMQEQLIEFFQDKDLSYWELEPMNIIEFGGWRGHLAKNILEKYPQITSWINYEIALKSITKSVCNDPRYTSLITSRSFWDLPLEMLSCNIFIASHSFEHIRWLQILAILNRLHQAKVEMIFIDIPIPDEEIPNWKDYNGTHTLDVSYMELIKLFYGSGYKLVNKVGTYAQFVRVNI